MSLALVIIVASLALADAGYQYNSPSVSFSQPGNKPANYQTGHTSQHQTAVPYEHDKPQSHSISYKDYVYIKNDNGHHDHHRSVSHAGGNAAQIVAPSLSSVQPTANLNNGYANTVHAHTVAPATINLNNNYANFAHVNNINSGHSQNFIPITSGITNDYSQTPTLSSANPPTVISTASNSGYSQNFVPVASSSNLNNGYTHVASGPAATHLNNFASVSTNLNSGQVQSTAFASSASLNNGWTGYTGSSASSNLNTGYSQPLPSSGSVNLNHGNSPSLVSSSGSGHLNNGYSPSLEPSATGSYSNSYAQTSIASSSGQLHSGYPQSLAPTTSVSLNQGYSQNSLSSASDTGYSQKLVPYSSSSVSSNAPIPISSTDYSSSVSSSNGFAHTSIPSASANLNTGYANSVASSGSASLSNGYVQTTLPSAASSVNTGYSQSIASSSTGSLSSGFAHSTLSQASTNHNSGFLPIIPSGNSNLHSGFSQASTPSININFNTGYAQPFTSPASSSLSLSNAQTSSSSSNSNLNAGYVQNLLPQSPTLSFGSINSGNSHTVTGPTNGDINTVLAQESNSIINENPVGISSVAPVTPTIFKHIYFHVPPPDVEEQRVTTPPPPPKKNYKIIFIKVPSQESKSNLARLQQLAEMRNAAASVEHKTLIYVLVKNPEVHQPVVVPKKTPSEHEVFFVKYNGNPLDLAAQVNEELDKSGSVKSIVPLEPGRVNGS